MIQQLAGLNPELFEFIFSPNEWYPNHLS
jgi:hypothetical protein